MQTTNLGNVAVENFGVKRSRVPINRNVFSSCGFGEVQVCQLLQVDPDTETSFNVENLTFVEPIVAPTYGHCSIKYWHYFVAMRDLFEDFDAFLASTNVRKMGGLFVTRYLPHTYRNLLSTLLLWGAKCTIYNYVVQPDGSRSYIVYRPTSTTEYTNCLNLLSASLGNFDRTHKPSYMSSSLSLFPTFGTNFLPTNPVSTLGLNSSWIDARALVDIPAGNGDYNFEDGTMKIPLANYSLASFMDLTGMPSSWSGDYYGLPIEPVVIGNHDYLIERPTIVDGQPTNTGIAFVFKATAFGKRIAKVLKGTGFQEDFTSTKKLSLMPLFATYKAYYECFGLLLYTNFENTNCKQLLVEYEQNSGRRLMPDFTAGFFDSGIPAGGGSYVNNFIFQAFIKDIGSLWVTDSQDLISAHTISPTVSVGENVDPNTGVPIDANADLREFIRNYIVGGKQSTSAVDIPQSDGLGDRPSNMDNSHAFIDRIIHSQVDCELLQILYLNTNHETLAGKRVIQLLQMAGFGDWMAHQKPRFIGYDEQSIEFNQVQSKADTLKDGSGMILGERGGVGESYRYHKQHTFTNNETGYIISLCAVVPDSGYVNTLNVAYECISKFDFFDQRFDGVGMELSPISRVVCGAQPNAIVDRDTLKVENVTDESFGYVPMETRHKFVTNIFNGVFALNSVMDNFTPYSLDKVIKLGEIAITSIDDTVAMLRAYKAQIVFDPKQTPRAGLVYRYPTRYPWLGRLARIFAAIGDNVDDGTKMGVFNMLMNGYEYFNEEQDGFVLLQTIRGGEWTHKLPITDSYETREDGNKGNIDTNVSKA